MKRTTISTASRFGVALLASLVAVCAANVALAWGGSADWTQFGQNAQHQGAVRVAAQSLNRILAQVTYDPFVAQEKADDGSLLIHFQTPLVRGNDVYMEFKTGTYTPENGSNDATRWNSQIWNERRLELAGGQLTTVWDFQSDWLPEPADLALGWQPVFHAALSGGAVYVPGLGGTVFKVDASSGKQLARINPFGSTIDPTTYVSGPLTADGYGNIYYNTLKLDANENAVGAWLVKIDPWGGSRTVSFASLVPNAPTNCIGAFDNSTLPWPASPTAVPPSQPCGLQRPGLNVAPAVAPNGTIYTISRAHLNERYSYVVAVNPDLTPKWAASMRDRLNDGCGVIVPIAPTSQPAQGACRNGATVGVDPQTNQRPAGRVRDIMSSSPTVLPDSSVLYGSWTRYDTIRGHTFEFGPNGDFKAAVDLGYDATPAVYQHDGVHIILKENHYEGEFGTYCNVDSVNPASQVVCAPAGGGQAQGPFYLTQLNENLVREWQFQNTTTSSDHHNGFEWCVNAAAVDGNGTVYVNSEDGYTYSIPQGHTGVFTQFQQRVFMGQAEGNAYTPTSISSTGVIFTSNNGAMVALGA